MGEASLHGGLAGQPWAAALRAWELGPSSLGARGSPTPVEDVMKLPKEDMATLGRWPAWDTFALVTCARCDRNVKLEAFESHVAIRHGTKSERSAYHRVTAARAAVLQACQVRLTPASPQPLLADRLALPTSTSGSSLASAPPSPQPLLPPLVESTTTSPAPPTPSPPPPPDVQEEVAMETPLTPNTPHTPTTPHTPHTLQPKPPYRGEEEADSTTNVISIPDSDELANIELISDGLDLLNAKFSFSTASQGAAAAPPPPAPPRAPPEPMEVDQNAPPAPTHYITVSPLAKAAQGSPRKVVRLPLAQEKRQGGREREYDPNRHCGVWDSENKRYCTRSLTCKSHSVYLKRKVINRTGPFDQLLAQHKAEKEAVTVRPVSAAADLPDPLRLPSTTSILETRLKLTTVPRAAASSIAVLQPTKAAEGGGCEDSLLHYTTDHPKPLAVCTFGGRRIGGLFITDRRRLYTRKVMKLGMTRAAAPIGRQQALPYIVVQEAFQSHLGDFKAGLKFELGSRGGLVGGVSGLVRPVVAGLVHGAEGPG